MVHESLYIVLPAPGRGQQSLTVIFYETVSKPNWIGIAYLRNTLCYNFADKGTLAHDGAAPIFSFMKMIIKKTHWPGRRIFQLPVIRRWVAAHNDFLD